MSDFGYQPAWSPDGREPVVASLPMSGTHVGNRRRSQLWAIGVDSGVRRAVTAETTVVDVVQPSWSPHGYRIAYWGIDARGAMGIYTIDASVPGARPVMAARSRPRCWNPFWAPSGKWRYFASDENGTMNLWRIAIDEKSGVVEGDPQPIVLPVSNAAYFTLSRDGRRLAYAEDTESWDIQRLAFDPQASEP